jgi:hypothetical protein
MNTRSILLLALAAVGVGAVWLLARSGILPAPSWASSPGVRSSSPAPESVPAGRVPAPSGQDSSTAAAPRGESAVALPEGQEAAPPEARAPARPLGGASQAVFSAPAESGAVLPEPIVAEPLARNALRLVGKDPAAEAIWERAINDPGLPANARSDLIEDLNDEGFPDHRDLTAADIPLILARLRLIERLSPLAMDDVNVAAFAEAYKDLLAMLARLRGVTAR